MKIRYWVTIGVAVFMLAVPGVFWLGGTHSTQHGPTGRATQVSP